MSTPINRWNANVSDIQSLLLEGETYQLFFKNLYIARHPEKLTSFQIFQSQKSRDLWLYCHCCSEQHQSQIHVIWQFPSLLTPAPNKQEKSLQSPPVKGNNGFFMERTRWEDLQFRKSFLTFLLVPWLSKSTTNFTARSRASHWTLCSQFHQQ